MEGGLILTVSGPLGSQSHDSAKPTWPSRHGAPPRNDAELAVIMVTANVDTDVAQTTLGSRAFDYVMKPGPSPLPDALADRGGRCAGGGRASRRAAADVR